MRAPQAASYDIAALAQMAAVALDARLQQLGALRDLALHLRYQGIADVNVERRGIGVACRCARHRDAAAGRFMQAERVRRAGIFEINEMKAVGDDEADRARQLLGDVL